MTENARRRARPSTVHRAGRRARPLVAALAAAALAVGGAGGAVAQILDPEPTTTTTAPPPVPTTTTTLPPPPVETTLAPVTVPPVPETAATPAPPPPTTAPAPAPVVPAPVPTAPVGGDAGELPPGEAPVIPPEIQKLIDSVRRSRANNTTRLLAALEPLRAMGMTEQEAVQAGFGRFPVGGKATFGDDWWYPRFGPAPGQVRLHEGTDIFAPYGTPARAPADGTLRQTFNALGGLSAYVVQADGTYFYLAHLARYEAGQVTGQRVKAGDVVGYVGDSGNARGSSPHIHFEVHPRGGGPVNPKPWLDAAVRDALAAVPAVIAEAAPRLATRPKPVAEEQELGVVGHAGLGGGRFGAVAVVGDTALVARDFTPPGSTAPSACDGTVAVVDLSDPSSPEEVGTLELADGSRAEDVDALAVRTPSFSGDLAAVVTGPCTPGDGPAGVAYYDVTDPARPVHLGGTVLPREPASVLPSGQEAEACARALRSTCRRSERSVELQVTAGARLLSLSSAGGRDAASRSDAFVVDVTDPRAPEPVGRAPLAGRARPPASGDGCSPVALAPAAGDDDPLPPMVDIAGFRWDAGAGEPALTGPDAPGPFATAVVVGGRRLAVVTDDDWWSSTWALRVDPPAPGAGDRPGCPGPLAAGDVPATEALSALAAGPTAGDVVYVGRACPPREAPDGSAVAADPYLADPAGRIAVADAALAPVQAGLASEGCSPASRLARLRADGALGLVVAGSFLAAEPGGEAVLRGATGVERAPAVPGVQLRKPDGDALRDALCPALPGAPGCGPAIPLAGSLVELPGRWGGLRLVDVTNPDAPREVAFFATPAGAAAAPAEAGRSHAVHAVAADGDRVYAAWGSDGMRVLDVSTGSPLEVAEFVPPHPDTDGATGPYVAGVGATDAHIVVSDLTTGLWVVDKRVPAGTRGYWLADEDGGVFSYGDAGFFGSAAGADLDSPVVGLSPSATGRGYRLVTRDGGVYAFGDAAFLGGLAGADATRSPVVGMAVTPSGGGYWLATAEGGVYAFGDAHFLGARTGDASAAPVTAVVATPTGRGYWLVARDGGVFAFGDAPFLGSTAGLPGTAPVVGATATASGGGYWLAADDGGVFAFGDARFKGSLVGGLGASPVTGIATMAGVRGYWLAGEDGAVHALGTPHLGARPGDDDDPAVVAMAAVPRPRLP